MRLRALFLVGVATLLAGCGGGKHQATTGATATGSTTALKVYFFRGAGLEPVVVHVPQTQAVAASALGALLAGPPSGYTTALPSGARLLGVSIVGGIAHARLDGGFSALPRTAQGQLVSTLEQFPSVHGVEADAGGTPIAFRGGNERPLGRPAKADDFADLTPKAPIFVEAPRRDSTVTSPVRAHGTADVFEATLQVDIWSGGRKLGTRTITATSGTGTRGTWASTFRLPSGKAKLDFYEPSAENGSHLHETVVLLTVR